ncbi:MAG: flagellar hook-length control protein FliK [Lutisporaceae bacterium]
MQGTMDIMAMMQKSNIAGQKTNTTSLGRDFDRFSFKRELADARKNTVYKNQDNRQSGSVKQEVPVIDNKTEKLAKVMSSNNVKTEKVLDVSKQEITKTKDTTQIKETDSAKADIKVEKPVEGEATLEEDTELTELVKSAEELLQQLMQLLSGENNTQATAESTEANVKQIEESLQAITQKLEQIISKPVDTEAEDNGIVLKDLKVELKELIMQLKAQTNEVVQPGLADKPTLQQTVDTIKHLINKMDELKPRLQQKLNNSETTQKTTEKVPEIAAIKSKDIKETDNKLVEMESSNKNVNLKAVSESNASENIDKESEKDDKTPQDRTELKELSKPVETADKPHTESLKDAAIPQNYKAESQVNVKEMNLNLKKGEMVGINKSDIVNQVVKKADIIIREGHSEMIMKLEPESLGKLNLKIVVENGLITAKFVAESQQVKEVLESSFNQLKDSLQEKGIAVQNFSVSVGQQAGESSSKQSFNQWKQSIKINNKTIGEFMELDDELMLVKNPYSFHEGKIDYKA